jgi:hypothetical protein
MDASQAITAILEIGLADGKHRFDERRIRFGFILLELLKRRLVSKRRSGRALGERLFSTMIRLPKEAIVVRGPAPALGQAVQTFVLRLTSTLPVQLDIQTAFLLIGEAHSYISTRVPSSTTPAEGMRK